MGFFPAPRDSTSRQAGPGPMRRRHGLHGRAALDEADALAIELERKWGCGRLRLVVPPELRARFDSQRWKLLQAQWHGGLEDVVREAGRMAKAWRALDAAAEAAGAAPLSPEVWELALPDGLVVALTRSRAEAHHVADDPRFVVTYTLYDIAELIEKHGPTSPGLASTTARRSRRKRARSTIRSIRRA